MTSSERVLRTLDEMSKSGLIRKGMLLSAYARHKVANSSTERLELACRAEAALLALMQEQDPDAAERDWVHVSLRRLNQILRDQGLQTSVELIRLLLKSVAQDGRGFGGSYGSLVIQHEGGEHLRIKLRQDRQQDIPEIRIVAILRRRREDEQPEFLDRCRSATWETPWVEIVSSQPERN